MSGPNSLIFYILIYDISPLPIVDNREQKCPQSLSTTDSFIWSFWNGSQHSIPTSPLFEGLKKRPHHNDEPYYPVKANGSPSNLSEMFFLKLLKHSMPLDDNNFSAF